MSELAAAQARARYDGFHFKVDATTSADLASWTRARGVSCAPPRGGSCWVWLPAHWPVLLAGLALGLRAGAAIDVPLVATATRRAARA